MKCFSIDKSLIVPIVVTVIAFLFVAVGGWYFWFSGNVTFTALNQAPAREPTNIPMTAAVLATTTPAPIMLVNTTIPQASETPEATVTPSAVLTCTKMKKDYPVTGWNAVRDAGNPFIVEQPPYIWLLEDGTTQHLVTNNPDELNGVKENQHVCVYLPPGQ